MEPTSALREWRWKQNLSLTELARELSVHLTTVARMETGESLPDADMVAKIEQLTSGAVTAAEMHVARLQWLKSNRPERFNLAETSPEAAE